MKIKLQVSGGFIPVNKESVIDAKITDTDLDELISAIHIKDNPNSQVRDGKNFSLVIKNKTISIDPNIVPEKFKLLFKELTENLKYQKR